MYRLRFAAGLIGLASLQGIAYAQPPPPPTVAKLQQRLSNVEAELQKIESSKQIDDLTVGDRISREFDAAGSEAKAAFDAAVSQTRTLTQTGGTPSQLGFLKQLETDIRAERDRTEKIVERIGTIDGAIRKGDIKLTTRAIQALTPAERLQFRRTLTKPAENDYKSKMPNLFRGSVEHLTDEQWLALQDCGACQVPVASALHPEGQFALSLQHEEQRGLLSAISDAMMPPAHAALGIGCYAICYASVGVACFECIAAAGAAAVTAYNAWLACKGGCCRCRWYKPWCCFCKGACLTAFLATLA